MTTEEAISIIERVEHTESKWPGTEDTLEALDMAIAALRAQQEAEANKPLTLDELRQMDGEIVFCEKLGVYARFKGVVRVANHYRNGVFIVGVPIYFSNTDDYGNTWLAYRHKLEED